MMETGTKLSTDFPCEEILLHGSKARSYLYMAGFISEVENEHINKRLREYRDRYVADSDLIKKMSNE